MTADLHTHTTASDGTMAPEELVGRAAAAGLQAVGVTDHDSLAGLAAAIAAGFAAGVEVVPGVELSCAVGRGEVHILGYYPRPTPRLRRLLEELAGSRERRAREMLEKLAALGMPLEWESLRAAGSVGRPHVAQALVGAGYVADAAEAFRRYLGRGGPAWVPRYKLTPAAAVAAVREAGGVAVLAHPGVDGAFRHLDELVEAGLQGIEAYHPRHAPRRCAEFDRRGRELGLIITGGSDCHGPGSAEAFVLGQALAPPEAVERLQAAADDDEEGM